MEVCLYLVVLNPYDSLVFQLHLAISILNYQLYILFQGIRKLLRYFQEIQIRLAFYTCFLLLKAHLILEHCMGYQKYELPYLQAYHIHNPQFFSNYLDDIIYPYNLYQLPFQAINSNLNFLELNQSLQALDHRIPSFLETML